MLSYAPTAASDTKMGTGRPMTSRLEPAAIYKRMVISLRSLFSYVRVLPAYRLFRACAVIQLRLMLPRFPCCRLPAVLMLCPRSEPQYFLDDFDRTTV